MVGATGAGAETDVATTVPFSIVQENTCTGEMVALTGQVHFLVGGAISGAGMQQGHAEANLQGVSGVALGTGANYVATDTSSQTLVFDSDVAPFHSKVAETALLVRQGETAGLVNQDDFYLHVLAQTTINANGDVSVEDITFTTTCR